MAKTMFKKRQVRKTKSKMRFASNLYPVTKTPELKVVDFTNTGSPPGQIIISTTAQFQLLNGLLLGSDVNNRIGRKVALKSLQFTGQIRIDQSKSGVDDYFRVMLVYDRQPTLSTIPPLLSSYDQASNVSSTAFDFFNISNNNRFKMLADIRYCMDGPASVGNFQSLTNTDYKGEYNINRYIKLNGLQTHYDNAVSTSIPVEGALYLVTYGSVAAASAPYSISFTSRVRFSDI